MRTKELSGGDLRTRYQQKMLELRGAFESAAKGVEVVAERADAVDTLLRGIWSEASAGTTLDQAGVALIAVGGYGRRQLFPSSDVDLMFLLDAKVPEKAAKDAIRRVSQ